MRARMPTGSVLALPVAALAAGLAPPDGAAAQAPAGAQGETAAGAGGTLVAGEIIVLGSRPIRESEEAALRAQRESPSLVSVVAADGIGRLPDQNIGQAIARLPGIAIENDQGQGRYVSIRGAPNRWSTISFDGINVVSPEGRVTRYDSVPSALAAQVVVNKAITPAMPGETIAGNVDIITRSAFDYPDLRIALKAGGGLSDKGERLEFEVSGVYANRLRAGDGEVGLVLSGSYFERDMITDNFETDWVYEPRDRRPGDLRIWARRTQYKFYRLKRTNWSVSGRLEWRPSPEHRLSVSSIYTIFTDDEARSAWRLNYDTGRGQIPNSPLPCPAISPQPPAGTTGYADVCTGNTPFRGTVYGITILHDTRDDRPRQSIFTNTLAGDHDFGDWDIAWRLNYTRSLDKGDRPSALEYTAPGGATNRTTVDYDTSDPDFFPVRLFRTVVNPGNLFARGAPVTRIEDFPLSLNRARDRRLEEPTDAYTARLDIGWNSPLLGGDTRLSLGLRYDRRTKSRDERLLDFRAADIAAAGIPRDLGFIAGTDPFRGTLKPGFTFTNYDPAKTIGITRSAAEAGGQFVFNQQNFYRVREEVFAAYLMGLSRFDWGSLLYGARVEHVRNRSSGNRTVAGGFVPITVESDTTLVFPSVHLNLDPTRDTRLRFTFSTGAARADYPLLRPNFVVDPSARTISGGNPLLEPEKVWGIDAYLEWYVRPRGFFSVGAYYKEARDILFEGSQLAGPDLLGPEFADFRLLSTINGGEGYIMGFEGALQLQLGALSGRERPIDGFGLQANASYNLSRATTPDGRRVPLPGTSRWVLNVGPYYEQYGVSARLSYQFRTKWLDALGTGPGADTIPELRDAYDLYWSSQDRLDFSIRYALAPRLEIYADLSNLLDSPGRRFQGKTQYTYEFETFGRKYVAGLRLTY